MKLRDRELAALEAVARYWDSHGLPPSIRDVQDSAGLSSSYVAYYQLTDLHNKGLVCMDPVGKSRSRAIRITDAGREHLRAYKAAL